MICGFVKGAGVGGVGAGVGGARSLTEVVLEKINNIVKVNCLFNAKIFKNAT